MRDIKKQLKDSCGTIKRHERTTIDLSIDRIHVQQIQGHHLATKKPLRAAASQRACKIVKPLITAIQFYVEQYKLILRCHESVFRFCSVEYRHKI